MVPREIKLGSSLSIEAVQKAYRKTRSVGEVVLSAASDIMPQRYSGRAAQEVASMVGRRELQIVTPATVNPLQESNVVSLPVHVRPDDIKIDIPLGGIA
jgi:single-stranded DNA-specific DHH superfamily exonuclease